MSIFSFGIYFGLLSHAIRLHLECHTSYKWIDWTIEYDEALNGMRICLELFKCQLFIGIGACVHDVWFFDSNNYFIRQEHNGIPQEMLQDYEEDKVIEES